MFSDPKKNVLEFGFLPGHKVADMGTGAGHYALALSEVLGPTGKVFAIDVNTEMLVRLKNEAVRRSIENVEVILGDIEEVGGTKLRDAIADGAVFSNIFFQLDDPKSAVEEVKRILRPGGRVCVVEWADLNFLSEALEKHKKQAVPEKDARQFFSAAGFNFLRKFDAGEHHYGLIFKLPVE